MRDSYVFLFSETKTFLRLRDLLDVKRLLYQKQTYSFPQIPGRPLLLKEEDPKTKQGGRDSGGEREGPTSDYTLDRFLDTRDRFIIGKVADSSFECLMGVRNRCSRHAPCVSRTFDDTSIRISNGEKEQILLTSNERIMKTLL